MKWDMYFRSLIRQSLIVLERYPEAQTSISIVRLFDRSFVYLFVHGLFGLSGAWLVNEVVIS